MTMLYSLLPFENICLLLRIFYKIAHISMLSKKMLRMVISWKRPLKPCWYLLNRPDSSMYSTSFLTLIFSKTLITCYVKVTDLWLEGGHLSPPLCIGITVANFNMLGISLLFNELCHKAMGLVLRAFLQFLVYQQ